MGTGQNEAAGRTTGELCLRAGDENRSSGKSKNRLPRFGSQKENSHTGTGPGRQDGKSRAGKSRTWQRR
jgi:hypothetical protein